MKHLRHRISLVEAVQRLTSAVDRLEAESVATEQSLARMTSEPVRARHSAPHYRASAMDGVAVRAAQTHASKAGAPIPLRALERPRDPGGPSAEPAPGELNVCLPVDTGDPVPDWADAVVRIENTRTVEDGYEVLEAVFPGKDIRRAGEDIEEGSRILPRAHRIGAFDIGALLATGVSQVEVVRKPRIATVATGGEIVEPGGRPQPGRVIEFNARVLSALVEDWGGSTSYLGGVGDSRKDLATRVIEATADNDVVCVMAGSSVGRKDFTVEVLGECGKLLLHGVDIMPGHPVAAAEVEGTIVFAVPGYPVSAVVVYREMVAPLLARMLGTARPQADKLRCRVMRNIPSRLGMEEFLRVCVRCDDEMPVAAPLPRGAGSIGSVVEADGFLRISPSCEGIEAGSVVDIELLHGRSALRSCLMVAGRPNPPSDELEDRLRRRDPSARFRYLGRSGEEIWQTLLNGEAHLAIVRPADAAETAQIRRRTEDATEAPLRLEPLAGGSAMLIASPLLDRHPAAARLLACARRKDSA